MSALDIDAVTSHYRALVRKVPLMAITREADYKKAVAVLDELLDAGGANERHPLAGLVDALGQIIESYESRAHRLPDASPRDASPRDALLHLMQAHGLKQTDLSALASQGAISAILNGKRGISRQLALKLAERFAVPAGVFVG